MYSGLGAVDTFEKTQRRSPFEKTIVCILGFCSGKIWGLHLKNKLLIFLVFVMVLFGFTSPSHAAPKCSITGTSRADFLRGTDGPDVICGLAGDDIIYGFGADDYILGGSGDDTIDSGDGLDYIDSGTGNDTVDAGSDSDTIWLGDGSDSLSAGEGDDVIYAGAGNDSVESGDGADKVTLGDGSDSLSAGAGDDLISAGSGNDIVDAGLGQDTLSGGAGADKLFGQGGNDKLSGEAGNDLLSGGIGLDNLLGGSGKNQCDGAEGEDVTGCFYDDAAPALVAISTDSPNSEIYTNVATPMVTIRARIVDLGTGMRGFSMWFKHRTSGVEMSSISWYDSQPFQCQDGRAQNPSGTLTLRDGDLNYSGSFTSICRISGDASDGVYEIKFLIDPRLQFGKWDLDTFATWDGALNQGWLHRSDLNAQGINFFLNQVTKVDVVPPTIVGFAVAAKSLNSSQSDAIVPFRVHLRDDISGLLRFQAVFQGPLPSSAIYVGGLAKYLCDDPQFLEFQRTYKQGMCRVSGDLNNGIWEGYFVIPKGSPKGKYILQGISVSDQYSNTSGLSRSDIEKKKWLIDINQLGPGESQAPGNQNNRAPEEILGIQISEVESSTLRIDTKKSPQTFEISILFEKSVQDSTADVSTLALIMITDDMKNVFNVSGIRDPANSKKFTFSVTLPAHFRKCTLNIMRISGQNTDGGVVVVENPNILSVQIKNG